MSKKGKEPRIDMSCDGTTLLKTGESHTRYLNRISNDVEFMMKRNKWKSHSNSANMLLLEAHVAFRRNCNDLFKQLLDSVSAGKVKDQGKVILQSFSKWHEAMNEGHEKYEESKLYPYLEARFQVDLAYLRKEHQDMHDGRDKVITALKYMQSNGVVPENAVQDYIDYDAVLKVHLMEEEEIVIPLLLAMSIEEMKEFEDRSLQVLLKKFKNSKR